jgi:putative endonuclease
MERKIRTTREKTGDLGEKIAIKFLKAKGFDLVERNYRKKWGEIDIICLKGRTTYFIEVKTVSRSLAGSVVRGDGYRAEDNVHRYKLERISRTIESYLAENQTSREGDWQFDLVTVVVDKELKKAKVERLENIILQSR